MRFFKFVSRNATPEEPFFNVPRRCLGFMGYWPECGGRKTIRIVNFIILFIGVATELHAGFTYLFHNNLALGLGTLCPAGTSAVTLLKMYLILYFRKDLHYVLTSLRAMLHTASAGSKRNTEKQSILQRYALLTARLNFWPLLGGFLTASLFGLKPLLIALVLWFNGKPVVWNLPYNMTMPSCLLHPPWFPLTYIFTAYTGYVTIFMFGGCDAFYFEFCAQIAALSELLQADVRALFRPYKSHLVLSFCETQLFEADLIKIIRRHNEIIDLTEFFRRRYVIITLAHFVSAGMMIGMSIVEVMMYTTRMGSLSYIAYTTAALSQLLIYCYGGTLVAENSVQLARVVGTCPWQMCRPRQRRMLLLIILRSQRAVSMAVPFFSPSLATFTTILQTSGSIIALASSFQ